MMEDQLGKEAADGYRTTRRELIEFWLKLMLEHVKDHEAHKRKYWSKERRMLEKRRRR